MVEIGNSRILLDLKYFSTSENSENLQRASLEIPEGDNQTKKGGHRACSLTRGHYVIDVHQFIVEKIGTSSVSERYHSLSECIATSEY